MPVRRTTRRPMTTIRAIRVIRMNRLVWGEIGLTTIRGTNSKGGTSFGKAINRGMRKDQRIRGARRTSRSLAGSTSRGRGHTHALLKTSSQTGKSGMGSGSNWSRSSRSWSSGSGNSGNSRSCGDCNMLRAGYLMEPGVGVSPGTDLGRDAERFKGK